MHQAISGIFVLRKSACRKRNVYTSRAFTHDFGLLESQPVLVSAAKGYFFDWIIFSGALIRLYLLFVGKFVVSVLMPSQEHFVL